MATRPKRLPYGEFIAEMKQRLNIRNHCTVPEMIAIFDFVQIHAHYIHQHPKLEKTVKMKLHYLAAQKNPYLRQKCCQYWSVMFSASTIPCSFLVTFHEIPP